MPTIRSRRIPALLATVLLAAGCIGQPTSPPSPGPTTPPSLKPGAQPTPNRTLPPRPTPTPDLGCEGIVAALPAREPDQTLPPIPDPAIAGADAKSIAAFEGGVARLAALGSYQFSVDTYGIDVIRLELTTVDYALRGTISRSDGFAMDTLVGMRMREFDNSAAISSGSRWAVGGDFIWALDNVSDVLEPARLGPGDRAFYLAFTPDGISDRLLVPFAGGYRRLGNEKHGGVMTQHFRTTPRGAAAYAAAFKFDGEMTADVWIAAEGGQLAGARIAGKASHRDASGKVVDDSVFVEFEVTHPNDPANVVDLPTPPVPDRVQPSRPPVDLRLEYEVMRSEFRDPTTRDVQTVGVNLRGRLDISRRPVRVTVGQPDKIVVTICGTTHPQDDRRLIVSNAELTIVPLPASDYGTMTRSGSKALPAVGGPIDPGLAPIAPPEDLGHTRAHVDPVTGRRGLAFWLGNKTSGLFQTHAKAHPGEYVAVVLDGRVLANLAITDQLAKGTFMFTGDYTEAEVEFLLAYLRADPLAFDLRLAKELELPAAR